MVTKDSLLINRAKGIKIAIKGAGMLLKNELSIKVQIIIAVIITLIGFYYKISPTEWMIQILTISIVLGAEGLNTAIEELANFVHPEHHKKIGYLKDIAAGAVLFTAFAAIIIACIIYIPKI